MPIRKKGTANNTVAIHRLLDNLTSSMLDESSTPVAPKSSRARHDYVYADKGTVSSSLRLSHATNELVRLQGELEKRKKRDRHLETEIARRTEEARKAKQRASGLQTRITVLEDRLDKATVGAEDRLSEIHTKTKRLARRLESMHEGKEKQLQGIRAIAESAVTAGQALHVEAVSRPVLGSLLRLLDELVEECDVPRGPTGDEGHTKVLEQALATTRRELAAKESEVRALRDEQSSSAKGVASFVETLRDQVQSLQSMTSVQQRELAAAQARSARLEQDMEDMQRARDAADRMLDEERAAHRETRKALAESEAIVGTVRDGYREQSRIVSDFIKTRRETAESHLGAAHHTPEGGRLGSTSVRWSSPGATSGVRTSHRMSEIDQELDQLRTALQTELGDM